MRRRMPPIMIAILIVAGFFGLMGAGTLQQPAQTYPVMHIATHGALRAPAFSLNLIDVDGLSGEAFSFNPESGRPVFMSFVIEWCPRCNEMEPIIHRLHREYGGRVFFLTVAGGFNTNSKMTADYLRRHNITWTVVYDYNMEVFRKYYVTATPTYFIISPDGYIMARLDGEQDYQTLAGLLNVYAA